MNPAKAIPVLRGCGTRCRGGLYAECGLGPNGSPVEDFLMDPPVLLDFARLGVIPRGTHLVERNGVTHLFDWIGAESYGNVADFIEEVRRFGLSRRLSPKLDFSKLTGATRILLVHSRAYVENFADYARAWEYTETASVAHPFPRCPKHKAEHDQEDPPACCVGLYWQDIEGGLKVDGASKRTVGVRMPSFSYNAFSRPDGLKPKYLPAVFASFPITRLVAIADGQRKDEANLVLLKKSVIPAELEDE